MTQLETVVQLLRKYRVVPKTELQKVASPKSIPTYMVTLRRLGHKIKYSNGNYYYGGVKVKPYAEMIPC